MTRIKKIELALVPGGAGYEVGEVPGKDGCWIALGTG